MVVGAVAENLLSGAVRQQAIIWGNGDPDLLPYDGIRP